MSQGLYHPNVCRSLHLPQPLDGGPTVSVGRSPDVAFCPMSHPRRWVLLDDEMLRLLLVENQTAVRSGLRMWFKLAPEVAIVGEAGDGLAALSQAAVARPDVILLDIESAGMDGAELIRALRKASPESAVVILSLSDDTVTRRRAAAAGAAAFVSKHECGDRLLQSVRRAAAKEDERSVMTLATGSL